VLSRDCDGCPLLWECSRRFNKVVKGEKVYCPDGTAHLVDESSISQNEYPSDAQLNMAMIQLSPSASCLSHPLRKQSV
jgi:hypothetical protein